MYAFLDIETGGFSITKNGVCEIGILITDQNFNKLCEFEKLIQPYCRPESEELVSYKDDAMAVNGISVDALETIGTRVDHVLLEMMEILDFNDVKTIIGHNSDAFDIPRVNHLLERFLKTELKGFHFQDTKKIAKEKYQLDSYSLENLCTQFKITNQKAHSALSDAYATMELFKILI